MFNRIESILGKENKGVIHNCYDYSKLRGRIEEIYGPQYKFAEAMGLSDRSMSLKMTGKLEFKQKEIDLACQLLHINKAEIAVYFFKKNVQKN